MWTFENAPLDWIEEAYGFRPDQKWLDHARLASLRFGGGCSASFVSPRGLIMTNHHCARGNVATASPQDADWLKNGYFARSLKKEVKLAGLTVQQLVSMKNITKEMNAGLDQIEDPGERSNKLNENREAIMTKARADNEGLTPQVVSLYQGGMYQLYVYKIYSDIRLVATPHMQSAKFGGDPDNFTFPRYCLDYTFVRAYEDDKPIDTSKHYFKWRTKGPEEGDAVFVTGNPGSTGRLNTVAQMEFMRDAFYPQQLSVIHRLIKRAEEKSAADPSQAKSLRTRILSLENARKAYGGYLDGLRKPAVIDTKRKAETAIRETIDKDPKLKAKYGMAWTRLEEIVEEKIKLAKEGGMRGDRFQALAREEKTVAKLIGEAFFAVYGTAIPPDASFTLRLSDGTVRGFPMNGTVAPYFTTLYGLYGRYTEFGGQDPFHLPEAWLKKESKLDLKTPFNLVSTCDIIGGNSGSPMLNKNLEVVGLVFDGNIESLSNRFVYMDDVPRTVCVHPAIIIASLRHVYNSAKLADEIEGKGSKGYK